jgi:hypothetical protein
MPEGCVREAALQQALQCAYPACASPLCLPSYPFPASCGIDCFLQTFLQVREGQRSVLKKMCEQDLPSRVPVVLIVSAIRTRDSNAKQQQQQQDEQQQQARGGGRSSRSASSEAAAGGAEVQSIQLSDGWYGVNASLDGPLTELVAAGRIQVGLMLPFQAHMQYAPLAAVMHTAC